MKRLFHLLLRKLNTFRLIIDHCSNWPSISLAKLGLARNQRVVRLRNGLKLLTRANAPLPVTWGEIIEPAVADVYGIGRRKPDLIIDVGANIGGFTCFAAYTHPHAAVHAFEPSPEHASMLEENLAVNDISNVVLHRAPATKDGREVIFSEQGTGGGSGIILHEGGRPVPMQSLPLDSIDLSRARSLFLKLDCEGAEGELIEWVCANLPALPAQIAIACEHHPWCPLSLDHILHLLRQNGFTADHRTPFDESYIFASRG